MKNSRISCHVVFLQQLSFFRPIISGLSLVISLLLASSAWAAQTSDCAVKMSNIRIISYQGDCRNGFIDGKADVLYERKNSDGTVQTVRHFGWFNQGVRSGIHILLNSSSDKTPTVLLMIFNPEFLKPDQTGSRRWGFWLDTWPIGEMLGNHSLIWLEARDKEFSLEKSFDLPPLKDSKGAALPANAVMGGRLFYSAAARSKELYVQSVNANALRNFLNSVSRSNPFVTSSHMIQGDSVLAEPDPKTQRIKVLTSDGCGFDVSASSSKQAQQLMDNYEKRQWDGLCVDGMAQGAGIGTYTYDDPKYLFVSTTKYEWVQSGRGIGATYTTNNSDEITEGYAHPASEKLFYTKINVNGRLPIGKEKISTVMKGNEDGSKIIYKLWAPAKSLWAQQQCGKGVNACLVRMNYLPGSEQPNIESYPCTGDCLGIWNAHISPVLDEMDAFIAENKPKVDEIIQANTSALSRGTTLQQRLNNANQAKESAKRRGQEQAALIARQEEAAARKSAESKHVLNEANQARKPVQSPNLDALIKRIPLQQAKGKKGKKK